MDSSWLVQKLKSFPTFDVHQICEHLPDPSEDLEGAIALLKKCIVSIVVAQRDQYMRPKDATFASIAIVFKLCLDLGYNVHQDLGDGEELNISSPAPNGYVVKFAKGREAKDLDSAFCIELLDNADMERMKRAMAKRQRKAHRLQLK